MVVSNLIAGYPLDGSEWIHCLLHRLNPDPADSRDLLTPRAIFRLRSSSGLWFRSAFGSVTQIPDSVVSRFDLGELTGNKLVS